MDKTITSKTKIFNAAAELFRSQGYHATSLNQITKNSEASRGSIYYYFPKGKEQLAIEAIKQTGENRKDFIKHHLSQEDDAALSIHKQVSAMADALAARMESLDNAASEISLVSMTSEVSASNETIRLACEAVYIEWQQMYYEKLTSSGYSQETAERLAVSVQAMIEGAYVLSITSKNSKPMQLISEQILEILQQ